MEEMERREREREVDGKKTPKPGQHPYRNPTCQMSVRIPSPYKIRRRS